MSRAKDWEARFWSKVDKTGDHWIWRASLDTSGYGNFGITAADNQKAHKLAYELLVGPVPEGLMLSHTCQVRACVNPDHLTPATRSEAQQVRARANRNSRSGVKGVSWGKTNKKWMVVVTVNKVRRYGGGFDRIEDAEAAAIKIRQDLIRETTARPESRSGGGPNAGHG